MKINEITEAEILDRLVKGAKAAVQGYTQNRDTRVNAQAIAQMSQVAARAWGKMKQNLERINNYTPLSNAKLLGLLKSWIDDNLLGSYSLANGGNMLNKVVDTMATRIISEPGEAENSFQQILNVASKVALDPSAGKPNFNPQGQTSPGDTAPFNVVNKIATAGNLQLDLRDKEQLELYNKFRAEWGQNKGIIT